MNPLHSIKKSYQLMDDPSSSRECLSKLMQTLDVLLRPEIGVTFCKSP